MHGKAEGRSLSLDPRLYNETIQSKASDLEKFWTISDRSTLVPPAMKLSLMSKFGIHDPSIVPSVVAALKRAASVLAEGIEKSTEEAPLGAIAAEKEMRAAEAVVLLPVCCFSF